MLTCCRCHGVDLCGQDYEGVRAGVGRGGATQLVGRHGGNGSSWGVSSGRRLLRKRVLLLDTVMDDDNLEENYRWSWSLRVGVRSVLDILILLPVLISSLSSPLFMPDAGIYLT